MKKIAADRNYRMLKRALEVDDLQITPEAVAAEALKIAMLQGWAQGSFNHYTNKDFSDLGTLNKEELVRMYEEEAKSNLFQDQSETVRPPERR